MPATRYAWASRHQVRLGKFSSCRVEPVSLETAKAAGTVCGNAGTADVVDSTVVVMAATLGAIIWTSSPGDIHAVADAVDLEPALVISTV